MIPLRRKIRLPVPIVPAAINAYRGCRITSRSFPIFVSAPMSVSCKWMALFPLYKEKPSLRGDPRTIKVSHIHFEANRHACYRLAWRLRTTGWWGYSLLFILLYRIFHWLSRGCMNNCMQCWKSPNRFLILPFPFSSPFSFPREPVISFPAILLYNLLFHSFYRNSQ